MEIAQSFEVDAPIDRVWKYLTDPEQVAAALPGANIGERIDEQTYRGGISVRVGPVSATYDGTVRFQRLDEGAHVAEIVAEGKGRRGMGTAAMRMTGAMTALAPDRTRVEVTSDVQVTGPLARFGRGMIERVSEGMLKKFAERLSEDLSED